VEALEFEGWLDMFGDLGVSVAGCSVDDLEAQQAFSDKLQLRFPLIADPDRSVSMAYGVTADPSGVASRSTVVIGADRAIRRVYEQVKGRGHAERVLADLRAEL
jgi:thioredoxin-dependent peroxiredoxin